MKLQSTSNHSKIFSFKNAVIASLAQGSGLFMPVNLPKLPQKFFSTLQGYSLKEIAYTVSRALIAEDIPDDALHAIIEKSITFSAPLARLNKNIAALELFHGPTLAFKDFGAGFMAAVMSHFQMKEDKDIVILTATSGDTGAAVGHAFFRAPKTRVIILYPQGSVSEIQEKQITALGKNITALEVVGSFDDCQALVKRAFQDQDITKKIRLASANSINIARLIPQMFYYFHAYAEARKINDAPLVFSVPSGNFGNLTAGLMAKRIGLPVRKFIAATNINDVVPRYLESGQFIPKQSQKTISNAMDIGNPSNFARIAFLYNNDRKAMRKDIFGASFSDDETKRAIAELYKKFNYIADPHGAVAYLGLNKYFARNKKENALGIFLETADPAKFKDIMGLSFKSRLILK